MTYNPTPKWAKVELSPGFVGLECPDCGANVFSQAYWKFGKVQTAGYYHPAYIPPELVFTCPGCEVELEIPLVVHVLYTGLPRRV